MTTTIEPEIREHAEWSVHAYGDLITLGRGREDTLEAAKEAAMEVLKKNSYDQMHAWVEHMKRTLNENGGQDKVLEYGDYRLEFNEDSDKQWVKSE